MCNVSPDKRSTLVDRAINGLFWMLSGTGVQITLKFIVLIILARLLSPYEFGVVGAAMVIISFMMIFGQVGVGPALVQRPVLTRLHVRTGFTLSVCLAVALGCLVVLVSPLVAAFFRMPELESVMRVLALVIPITGLSIVAEALLQREMLFKKLARVEMLSVLFGYGVVGVVLAVAGLGVWALVGAYIAHAAAKTILLVSLTPRTLGFPIIRFVEARDLLCFGAGFSLGKVANLIASHADSVVVGRFLGAEALGSYGRGQQIVMTPATLFGTVVDKVLFPALATVQDHRERLSSAFLRALSISAALTLPLSAILVVLAPELVAVLLGAQWMAVVVPLQLLAAVLVFRMGSKMSDSLAKAAGAVHRRAWRQCVYAIVVFLSAYIGHFWGLPGIAAGVGFAVVLNYLLMLHLSRCLTSVTWPQVAAVYGRHVVAAVLVVTSTVALAEWLRGETGDPLLVLLLSMMPILIIYTAVVLFFPKVLGTDAAWLLGTLRTSLSGTRRAVRPTPKSTHSKTSSTAVQNMRFDDASNK